MGKNKNEEKDGWGSYLRDLSSNEKEFLLKLNKYNDLRLGARDFVLHLKACKDFFVSFYKFLLFFGNKYLFKRKEYRSIKDHEHFEGTEIPSELKKVFQEQRIKNMLDMSEKFGKNTAKVHHFGTVQPQEKKDEWYVG